MYLKVLAILKEFFDVAYYFLLSTHSIYSIYSFFEITMIFTERWHQNSKFFDLLSKYANQLYCEQEDTDKCKKSIFS